MLLKTVDRSKDGPTDRKTDRWVIGLLLINVGMVVVSNESRYSNNSDQVVNHEGSQVS